MTTTYLAGIYRDDIACLNSRDWAALGRFVHDDVRRDAAAGGHRRLLVDDVEQA